MSPRRRAFDPLESFSRDRPSPSEGTAREAHEDGLVRKIFVIVFAKPGIRAFSCHLPATSGPMCFRKRCKNCAGIHGIRGLAIEVTDGRRS